MVSNCAPGTRHAAEFTRAAGRHRQRRTRSTQKLRDDGARNFANPRGFIQRQTERRRSWPGHTTSATATTKRPAAESLMCCLCNSTGTFVSIGYHENLVGSRPMSEDQDLKMYYL